MLPKWYTNVLIELTGSLQLLCQMSVVIAVNKIILN